MAARCRRRSGLLLEDEAPHWSVNFWVSDADAIAVKAAELGGEVISPPPDGPGGTFREGDFEGAPLRELRLVKQL
jgi:hypothetical protein